MDDTSTPTSAPSPGPAPTVASAPVAPPAGPELPPRRDPRPVVNLPDGRARLVGEVAIRPAERPAEELVLQAVESSEGEPLLRVGYRRDGRMLRGPMTARAADLGALLGALRADALLPESFWAASGLGAHEASAVAPPAPSGARRGRRKAL